MHAPLPEPSQTIFITRPSTGTVTPYSYLHACVITATAQKRLALPPPLVFILAVHFCNALDKVTNLLRGQLLKRRVPDL